MSDLHLTETGSGGKGSSGGSGGHGGDVGSRNQSFKTQTFDKAEISTCADIAHHKFVFPDYPFKATGGGGAGNWGSKGGHGGDIGSKNMGVKSQDFVESELS